MAFAGLMAYAATAELANTAVLDGLRTMAGGGEMPKLLAQVLAQHFGCFPISQSLNELDVKVVKAILADLYSSNESIEARLDELSRLTAPPHA